MEIIIGAAILAWAAVKIARILRGTEKLNPLERSYQRLIDKMADDDDPELKEAIKECVKKEAKRWEAQNNLRAR